MIVVNNPLGQDPVNFNEETSAERVGQRIREIRTARNMTQSELGRKVGLPADRIQKYENGARKPKQELLKSIADALGVDTLALTDPVVSNYLGAMYALFEMEKYYDLRIEKDGKIKLVFGDGVSGSLNDYLRSWSMRQKQRESDLSAASTDEEKEAAEQSYRDWEWTFPEALTDESEEHLKAKRAKHLEESIEKMQRELSDLKKDGEP